MPLSATHETAASPSRNGYGIAFWCMALLIALSVYVGAYFALVERDPYWGITWGIAFTSSDWNLPDYPVDDLDTSYSTNPQMDEFLRRAFGPIHWIDTRIRDKYWDRRQAP